jgi:hypothetical protein
MDIAQVAIAESLFLSCLTTKFIYRKNLKKLEILKRLFHTLKSVERSTLGICLIQKIAYYVK